MENQTDVWNCRSAVRVCVCVCVCVCLCVTVFEEKILRESMCKESHRILPEKWYIWLWTKKPILLWWKRTSLMSLHIARSKGLFQLIISAYAPELNKTEWKVEHIESTNTNHEWFTITDLGANLRGLGDLCRLFWGGGVARSSLSVNRNTGHKCWHSELPACQWLAVHCPWEISCKKVTYGIMMSTIMGSVQLEAPAIHLHFNIISQSQYADNAIGWWSNMLCKLCAECETKNRHSFFEGTYRLSVGHMVLDTRWNIKLSKFSAVVSSISNDWNPTKIPQCVPLISLLDVHHKGIPPTKKKE